MPLRAMSAGHGAAYADIEACRTWLGERDDYTRRIGVIGFCMGGGFALMTAARGFDASADNYGVLPRDISSLSGACPIVASYGARDRRLAPAADALEQTLIQLEIRRRGERGLVGGPVQQLAVADGTFRTVSRDRFLRLADNRVDDAVAERLLSVHPVVAIDVAHDAVDRLARVSRQ